MAPEQTTGATNEINKVNNANKVNKESPVKTVIERLFTLIDLARGDELGNLNSI